MSQRDVDDRVMRICLEGLNEEIAKMRALNRRPGPAAEDDLDEAIGASQKYVDELTEIARARKVAA